MNFELEFPYEDDSVYLAYSKPYPYSQIIAHMLETEERLTNEAKKGNCEIRESESNKRLKISSKTMIYERNLLCRTICGLPVPLITVTANKP